MRRLIVVAICWSALVLSTVSVAAQQPAAQTQPNAMVQVFVAKGYLTAGEAERILQAPTQAEANDRMLRVFLAKGMLTQEEFLRASGGAVEPAAGSAAGGAQMMNAAALPTPGAPASPPVLANPAPPARMAEWPVSSLNIGYDPSDGTPTDASVIPAIAPVRLLPIGVPKDPKGIIPDIKLGSGAMLNLYGFIKATAIYDTTNSGGSTTGSNDFPLPLLLNTGNGDTGPDSGSQFRIKARSTRWGANFFYPMEGPGLTLTGKIEMDFEGDYTTIGNRNVTSIRSSQVSLRLAWARLDGKFGTVPWFVLFGQDWSPLASSTMFDLVESSQVGAFFGNPYQRQPQFRTGLQFSAGKLKIQPEFSITLSAFGDANLNNSASSALDGSAGVIPTGFQNQNREGAILGQASGEPGVEGRLVFDFPLNSGWKGVPNAEFVVSAGRAEATYILPIGNIPNTPVASLTLPTDATPVGLLAGDNCATPATGAYPGFSVRCYYPKGLTMDVPQNQFTAEWQLPTPWVTLVGKYYRGADMRFLFGAQLNSAFRATTVGADGAIVAPFNILAGPITTGIGCTTAAPCAPPAGTPNQPVYALPGDVVTFSEVGGRATVDPYRPVRGQGGFAQLGFPLSRIFGANPEGLNSGWTFYVGYGVDSAFARDVRNSGAALGGNGLLRSDYVPISLRYKINKWAQIVQEVTWYDTRTADSVTALFRGVDAHVNHDIRNEFGTIFTF